MGTLGLHQARAVPGHCGVIQPGGFAPILVDSTCCFWGLFWLPCTAELCVSLQNVTANHRASDVIICEGKAQVLSGRFMYGPLDVVTLTGEKVLCGDIPGALVNGRDTQEGTVLKFTTPKRKGCRDQDSRGPCGMVGEDSDGFQTGTMVFLPLLRWTSTS